jgi:hypothetical protein
MIPGNLTGSQAFFATSVYVGGPGHQVFAHIEFQPNGNVARVEGSTLEIAQEEDEGDWYAPNTANIGGGYWLRITRTSGSGMGYDGAPLNTWISILTGPRVRHQLNTGGFLFVDTDYSVEISNDAGATTLVTHTVNIYVATEV